MDGRNFKSMVNSLMLFLAVVTLCPASQANQHHNSQPFNAGSTGWTAAENKNVHYRFVFYPNKDYDTEPGIYRLTLNSSGHMLSKTQVVSTELNLVPSKEVDSFTDTNSGLSMSVARPNYALAAVKPNHLYIVTAKSVKRIRVEGLQIKGERYGIPGEDGRRYDAYLFVDPTTQRFDMMIFRDDGQYYHAANGLLDAKDRSVIETQTITTSADYKQLFTQALRHPNKPASVTLFQESDSKNIVAVEDRKTSSPGPTPNAPTSPSRPKELPPLNDVDTESKDGGTSTALKILATSMTDLGLKALADKSTPLELDGELKMKIARGLTKIQRGNIALLGEAGVGKSTDIETLVYDVFVKRDPELAALRDYNFISIDLGALSAGGSLRGNTETKIAAMIKLAQANKIIWVIDEVHSMRGLGSSSSHDSDMFEFIKTPLANGTFRMIGMTTSDKFWPTFGDDSALRRRFTIINKKAPTGEVVNAILKSWLKRHQLAEPTAEVLKEVVRISTEMDPTRSQPDAGISLLEEVYADIRLKQSSSPPTFEDARTAAVRFYEIDPSLIDPLRQTARIEKLKSILDSKIVGQDHAKKILIDMTEQVLADVHDNKRPRGMALLTGKKGLGKTEMVLAYAEGLDLPVKVIAMNSYNSSSGFNRIGLMEDIANALDKNAYTVVLFDELEKAPIAIQNELLFMLNNGTFNLTVNAKGQKGVQMTRTIDATKCTVIFTANAGEEHLREKSKPSIGFISNNETVEKTSQDKDFRAALEADNVSSVLLDRINFVVPFVNTTREDFKNVVALHFRATIKNIEERKNMKIEIANAERFCQDAAAQLFQSNMSNREALRLIQNAVRGVLGRALLGRAPVAHLLLKYENGVFSAEPVSEQCASYLKAQ